MEYIEDDFEATLNRQITELRAQCEALRPDIDKFRLEKPHCDMTLDELVSQQYAYRKGYERGRTMAGRYPIVKKLLELGVTPEITAQATGLTVEEVKKLATDS